MDNVKNDKYYISKIKEDLKFTIEHTKGMTKQEIEDNPLLVDSIMFRIIQIAENNAKLSEQSYLILSKKCTRMFLGWQSKECATE